MRRAVRGNGKSTQPSSSLIEPDHVQRLAHLFDPDSLAGAVFDPHADSLVNFDEARLCLGGASHSP